MESISDRWERLTEFGYGMCKFEDVDEKLSQRPDLHAFIRLDQWFPDDTDIVTSAEHDQIYLGVKETDVESLSDEQIVELSRCGVWLDSEFDCLSMFV